MEDICFPHISGQGCSQKHFTKAHEAGQLENQQPTADGTPQRPDEHSPHQPASDNQEAATEQQPTTPRTPSEAPTQRRRSEGSDGSSSDEPNPSSRSSDSLCWCSSVGPINWADEVEAEFSEWSDEAEGETQLQLTPRHRQQSAPQSYTEKIFEGRTNNRRAPSTPPSRAADQFGSPKGKKSGRKDSNNHKGPYQHGTTLPKSGSRGKGHPHHTWAESCTDAVLKILQEPGTVYGSRGWEALRRIWNVGPENLDNAVLQCLTTKPRRLQEHILLSFAAIDLSNVHNLSAYLNCLVKEHDTTHQVCLYFLAGLCQKGDRCKWVHPVNTKGWDALRDKWQITYEDLDYTVLNFLSKKTTEEQDDILTSLADMDLRSIHNLSAYLSSMIQKYDHHAHGYSSPSPSASPKQRRQDAYGWRERPHRPRNGSTNSYGVAGSYESTNSYGISSDPFDPNMSFDDIPYGMSPYDGSVPLSPEAFAMSAPPGYYCLSPQPMPPMWFQAMPPIHLGPPAMGFYEKGQYDELQYEEVQYEEEQSEEVQYSVVPPTSY
jgi:hypothetical protein